MERKEKMTKATFSFIYFLKMFLSVGVQLSRQYHRNVHKNILCLILNKHSQLPMWKDSTTPFIFVLRICIVNLEESGKIYIISTEYKRKPRCMTQLQVHTVYEFNLLLLLIKNLNLHIFKHTLFSVQGNALLEKNTIKSAWNES